MQHLGYTYSEEIMEEDDNRKIWHEIIDPEGQTVDQLPSEFRNISPYRSATREEFESAVNDIYFEHWVQKKVDTAVN